MKIKTGDRVRRIKCNNNSMTQRFEPGDTGVCIKVVNCWADVKCDKTGHIIYYNDTQYLEHIESELVLLIQTANKGYEAGEILEEKYSDHVEILVAGKYEAVRTDKSLNGFPKRIRLKELKMSTKVGKWQVEISPIITKIGCESFNTCDLYKHLTNLIQNDINFSGLFFATRSGVAWGRYNVNWAEVEKLTFELEKCI